MKEVKSRSVYDGFRASHVSEDRADEVIRDALLHSSVAAIISPDVVERVSKCLIDAFLMSHDERLVGLKPQNSELRTHRVSPNLSERLQLHPSHSM